ncbi:hypothetical protein BV22DRAFT_1134841 [Leucogyrophana mollusca]|uniref:Uncharacterized protein n=1 Tax=Leucogyrophana mollusca TaxID=85980 RepID=A0ACB8AZ34_9AGAM|nr:hypothetical protein BV22DRAFT_1134841 [Leucogyrophana mollusca]
MASAELIIERGMYIGDAFMLILWGKSSALLCINFCMFLQSSYLMLSPGRAAHKRKSRIFYVIYSAILLFFITVSTATDVVFGQLMWIEHRDVPRGPFAYFGENLAAWYNTFGTATDVAANAMGDGLLLYRVYMIWGSRPWVVAFPALIYLGSVVMAIMMTIESALPGANIWQGLAASFGIPWVALTISFNIIATVMIVTRLLLVYMRVRHVLPADLTRTYTGVISILVESALPFTILGVAYLAAYVQNSPTATALGFVWGNVVVVSPQLIILRVAMGVAWSKDTLARVNTSMVFAPSQGDTTGVETKAMGERSWNSDGTTVAPLTSKRSENSLTFV